MRFLQIGKLKTLFLLLLFICALGVTVWVQKGVVAAKNGEEVIEKIDSVVYRPQSEGVDYLAVDVDMPHVSKIVTKFYNQQTKRNKSYQIKSTLYWNHGKSDVKVFGLPENSEAIRDILKKTLVVRKDVFFTTPFKELFKDFTVKVSGSHELTATPKAGGVYKDSIEKYILSFNSDYQVTSLEVFTVDARSATTFSYTKLPNGKYVPNRSVMEIYGKGVPFRIVNDFQYGKTQTGHFFPTQMTTSRFANDKLLEKAYAKFSNFRVKM